MRAICTPGPLLCLTSVLLWIVDWSSFHLFSPHKPLLSGGPGRLTADLHPSVLPDAVPHPPSQLCSTTPMAASPTPSLMDPTDLPFPPLLPPLIALAQSPTPQSLPDSSKAAPAWEAGKLTAGLHFPFCSSRSNPSVSFQLCNRLLALVASSPSSLDREDHLLQPLVTHPILFIYFCCNFYKSSFSEV